jgi:hypothetical protein
MSIPNQPVPRFIRRLMPHASEEELQAATDTFLQYMALTRRIYERVTLERAELDSSDMPDCDNIGDAYHDV